MSRRLSLALLLALSPAPAAAQDLDEVLGGFEPDATEREMEDVLGGFDDEDPDLEHRAEPPVDRWWDLSGSLTLGLSHAYAHDPPVPIDGPDYRGLSRAQAQLALELDLDLPRGWKARIAGRGFRDWFYAQEGRRQFPDPVLENHERELEFQEVWLQGRLLPSLDLKVGRQILSWGRSDNLRVLDVLNPIDSREPGMVNVEDLKLPVAMTRLDAYWREWTLTGVAVHETRFDTGPVPGSDFFPPGVPGLPEQRPGNGGNDTEWALRLRGIFSGWDVSFHWARYFDDRPHSVGAPTIVPPFPSPLFVPVRLEHARLTLWGASGQIARGNWLLKSEVGWIRGLRFLEADPATGAQLRSRDRSRIDAMVGVEYQGITDVSIALELVNRHLRGFDSRLELAPSFTERNRVEMSLLTTADFLHDRLHATLVAIVFGAHAEDGAILRGQLAYDLRDALSVELGVVLFQKGERPPLDFLGHHDRLFAKLQYSF